MKKMKKKGQSTLEYVLTFSVIILIIAGAAYTALRPALEKVLDNTAAEIEKEANILLSQTATTTSRRDRSITGGDTDDGTDVVTYTYGPRDSRSGYSTTGGGG